MKSFTSLILLSIITLSFSFGPIHAFAQAKASLPTDKGANGELIPCGNDYNGDGAVDNYVWDKGVRTLNKTAIPEECGFTGFIQLINNVIMWLIKISTILATGMFAYAGISLMTSGGNPAAMTKFKGMLFKVLIGYIVIFIAWISVYTIVNALVNPCGSLDFIGATKNC